jgi:hypothetical protein
VCVFEVPGATQDRVHKIIFVKGKIKVKLFLCLINHALCHGDIWGSGGIAPPFLTSTLDGGEWSASRPGRFAAGKERLVPIG